MKTFRTCQTSSAYCYLNHSSRFPRQQSPSTAGATHSSIAVPASTSKTLPKMQRSLSKRSPEPLSSSPPACYMASVTLTSPGLLPLVPASVSERSQISTPTATAARSGRNISIISSCT
ncbi:hypothetical protein K456DRAFT_1171131 [Colletotrichum gloeosporioides 23]|nr:hypothetical protein K456DRAFT_1171131 [Colletotrichum gloeosporioides 23]